ncbi:TPA: ead/Ea22-like family protein [Klebsiella pneumoniae]|uniref:ead/Ea22-like family protein n=1 Tax=Klebsiella pneumoniae TaxID=573 RepID=UPI000E2AA034|nr:ead/Ea22-like family protein [Klebsiella pneumoniae]HBY0543133.1 ead/Ea22-like family protein [Klebsiella pneumoniae subsp. pneumoniae]MDW7518963.1 ead/Ea22-like family protein [Klebsiella pneumoniae]SWN36346.1 Ead domain protein [Klebsiella pneumoniae]VGL08588.1 Ead domain protein [Klebsiella pneumoniae]HBS7372908.1 ead/Ea22-like family protein [Klebsiella pneumoniae]
MANITELAQSLKAAAEKATQGRWEYYPGNTSIEYNVDSMDEDQGSIVYVDSGDFTQAQTDRNGEFIALANPANILALVEALETEKRICATWRKTAESTSEKLEKAQAAERRWHRVASRVHEQACESDVKIDELEAIRAAAEKLVRCKGRYHSEQNYRALAALFGVKTPDLPPLDDESHAVTVENLQESAYRAGLTAGWNLGLANNNEGFNKCLAAHTAGIKVEAE